MKILFLDIETAPNVAMVWGLFNQNISTGHLLNTGYTLSWAASWLGEEDVYFDSVFQSTPRSMVKSIHRMLDEADIVVHYNGTKFDIPTLNREFLLHGLPPPTPYKQVDLLKTMRSRFRLTSNKLDFVCKQLGLEGKTKHTGMDLWQGCMNKDPEAWALMEEYNVNDVIILEEVYHVLLPWIKNHPNMSVYKEDAVCPTCGGKHLQSRGFQVTTAGKYRRYRCNDCGTWSRAAKCEKVEYTKLVGVG